MFIFCFLFILLKWVKVWFGRIKRKLGGWIYVYLDFYFVFYFDGIVFFNLVYFIFWIGCVYYISSFFFSINDNIYYSICKNMKVVFIVIIESIDNIF